MGKRIQKRECAHINTAPARPYCLPRATRPHTLLTHHGARMRVRTARIHDRGPPPTGPPFIHVHTCASTLPATMNVPQGLKLAVTKPWLKSMTSASCARGSRRACQESVGKDVWW
eukprot:192306-Chlamydomonas_euryale.AAC.2